MRRSASYGKGRASWIACLAAGGNLSRLTRQTLGTAQAEAAALLAARHQDFDNTSSCARRAAFQLAAVLF